MRVHPRSRGISNLSLALFTIALVTVTLVLAVFLFDASNILAAKSAGTTTEPLLNAPTSPYSNSSSTSPLSSVTTEETFVNTSSQSSTSGQDTILGPQVGTGEVSTGVIVPLFTNDSAARVAQINTLIEIKNAYPTVPMLAVYNDYGGVGEYNASTAAQIKSMQQAGIVVLGYDPTWWATREISIVEAGMRDFYSHYRVNGIYLDQMPNWNYNGPQNQAYYNGSDGIYIPGYFTTLASYARSLGMNTVVANAGTDVPANFLGSVNTIGTFENKFLPSLNLSGGWNSIVGLRAWHTHYNKSNFMFFSYDVPSIDPQYVLAAAKYVGYMYITNGTDYTDRYSSLSPYLEQLVSILASEKTSS